MPPVGIVKMQTCFLGLNALRALHQDACDDLQAVGDPVLNFLKQHVLLTMRASFCFSANRVAVMSVAASTIRTFSVSK
jgi:hypothetical protein